MGLSKVDNERLCAMEPSGQNKIYLWFLLHGKKYKGKWVGTIFYFVETFYKEKIYKHLKICLFKKIFSLERQK